VISSDNLVLPVFVFFSRWDSLKEPVKIAMIGKYTALSDAYLSVIKALQHACMAAGLKLSLDWVEAQYLEPEAKETDAAKYETSWQQVRLNIAALYMSLPRMDS
jgi:CTP synthase (UTP-ammonia lyase)